MQYLPNAHLINSMMGTKLADYFFFNEEGIEGFFLTIWRKYVYIVSLISYLK